MYSGVKFVIFKILLLCSLFSQGLVFASFSLERHIIAALYFNLNLLREAKKNGDGTEQVKVVRPLCVM